MGYRLNRLDEPGFIAVSKPLLTQFGIHVRLESCADIRQIDQQLIAYDVTLFLTVEMNQIAWGWRLALMSWGVGLAH